MQVGSLVKSLTGRDKDRYYIIINIINDRFVSVADGNIRLLNKPKKKNLKHLKEITVFEKLNNKINENIQIFDKEVNKAINTYLQSLDKK